MIDRAAAIAAAQKLAKDDPQGPPVIGLGDVFTVDGGRSWTIHLIPEPVDLGDSCIAFDTPGTWAVVVNGEKGKARWVEML